MKRKELIKRLENAECILIRHAVNMIGSKM